MAKPKVAISERALVQRVNRKLKPAGEKMRIARGFWANDAWYEDTNLGRYFVIDIQRNFVADMKIDLESYARDLGVLAAWEELEQ